MSGGCLGHALSHGSSAIHAAVFGFKWSLSLSLQERRSIGIDGLEHADMSWYRLLPSLIASSSHHLLQYVVHLTGGQQRSLHHKDAYGKPWYIYIYYFGLLFIWLILFFFVTSKENVGGYKIHTEELINYAL